jgi:hypothetical protein
MRGELTTMRRPMHIVYTLAESYMVLCGSMLIQVFGSDNYNHIKVLNKGSRACG